MKKGREKEVGKEKKVANIERDQNMRKKKTGDKEMVERKVDTTNNWVEFADFFFN